MRGSVKVVVAAGALLLALGAAGGAGADGVGTAGLAVPGSFVAGYATPVLAVQVGGILPFVNLDVQPHNICIRDPQDTRITLGCGQLISIGGVSTDTPTDFLVAGTVYPFYCAAHPNMTGSLLALPGA